MLFSNLPKNTSQFLIILGLAAITYSGYHYLHRFDNDNISTHYKTIDSLNSKIDIDTSKVRVIDFILKTRLDSLSDIEFIKLSEEKLGLVLALNHYRYQIISEDANNKYLINKNKNIDWQYFISFWFGIALFIPGMRAFQKESDEDAQLKHLELYKNYAYTNCNSCGKSFTPLLKKATNKDGTIENAFCINCYESGEFCNPDLTVNEVYDNFKSFNPNSLISISDFRLLVRWKQNPYDEKLLKKDNTYSNKFSNTIDIIFLILFFFTLIILWKF